MILVVLPLPNVVASIIPNLSAISINLTILAESIINAIIFPFFSGDASWCIGSSEEESTIDQIAVPDVCFELQLGRINVDVIEVGVLDNFLHSEPPQLLPFRNGSRICFFGLSVENILQLVAAQEEFLEIVGSLLLDIFFNFLN